MTDTLIPFLLNSEGQSTLCMASNDAENMLESIRPFTKSEEENWNATLFCIGETISFKNEEGQVIGTMTPYLPIELPTKLQPVNR